MTNVGADPTCSQLPVEAPEFPACGNAAFVDFDSLWGHRRDVAGYAANLERFDARLQDLLPRVRHDDLLVITADHGNDPTTPSTDHSREHVPLLVTGPGVKGGRGEAWELALRYFDGSARA